MPGASSSRTGHRLEPRQSYPMLPPNIPRPGFATSTTPRRTRAPRSTPRSWTCQTIRWSCSSTTTFGSSLRVLHGLRRGAGAPATTLEGRPRATTRSAPPSWLLASLPLSARGFDADDAAHVPFFLGFNWAAFAGDVRAAGGFDPEFGPGAASGARGQESEAQKALRAIGVQPRFVPNARVWHYVPHERCSFAWAVRRKYAVGLMLGQHGGGKALSRSQRATGAARLGVTAIARTLLGHPDRGCLDFMNAVKQVGAVAARPSAPTRLTP